jgi:hypothetical protein
MAVARNRWKGFVTGSLAGIAGLAAMGWYFKAVAPLVSDFLQGDREPEGAEGGERDRKSSSLEDISIVGRQHRPGESSTAALGRIAYAATFGSEPRAKETRTLLSYLVHWGYGILQGGTYGALRVDAEAPDLAGGAVFGAGLWLLGDELAVPALGLQEGPGAVTVAQHVNRAGAHLCYGAATAFSYQVLRRLV